MSLYELFDQFKKKRILVVGDLMLDAYIIGDVSRISPEAPVPVLDKTSMDFRLGGAGNVALNLVALGATPIVASVIGTDKSGEEIILQLEKANVSTACVIKTENRKTTVKTRVIANKQQVIRIDDEQTDDINLELQDMLVKSITQEITKGIDAVIFEDYNKGVLTENLIHQLTKLTSEMGIISTVDPKKKNFLAYKGVTLFKPNLKELKDGLQLAIDPSNIDSVQHAAQVLEQKLENQVTFVTLSEHGVFIKKNAENIHIPAHFRNIADVSGAGDSVIATATLCLTAGATLSQLAEIANIAGGLACEKSGVSTVSLTELTTESTRLLKKQS